MIIFAWFVYGTILSVVFPKEKSISEYCGLFYLLVSSQGYTYFWTSSFGSSINEPHIHIDWTRKSEFVLFRLTLCVIIAMYAFTHIYIYVHIKIILFFGAGGTLPTKQDVKMPNKSIFCWWMIDLSKHKYRYVYICKEWFWAGIFYLLSLKGFAYKHIQRTVFNTHPIYQTVLKNFHKRTWNIHAHARTHIHKLTHTNHASSDIVHQIFNCNILTPIDTHRWTMLYTNTAGSCYKTNRGTLGIVEIMRGREIFYLLKTIVKHRKNDALGLVFFFVFFWSWTILSASLPRYVFFALFYLLILKPVKFCMFYLLIT